MAGATGILTAWRSRRSVAILGVAINLTGLLGGALYVLPMQEKLDSVTLAIVAKRTQARAVTAATEDAEFAQDTCNLVFSVGPAVDASNDSRWAMKDIYLRSLRRRHDAVRAYIVALAAAGAIDFESESARYESLASVEAASLTLESYKAANAYLADLSMRMVGFSGDTMAQSFPLLPEREALKRALERRQALLIVIATFGSAIIAAAAMIAAGPRESRGSGGYA